MEQIINENNLPKPIFEVGSWVNSTYLGKIPLYIQKVTWNNNENLYDYEYGYGLGLTSEGYAKECNLRTIK